MTYTKVFAENIILVQKYKINIGGIVLAKSYKCTYCKTYIPEEELHLEPKRIGKKGKKENREVKLNAKGEIEYSRYHKKCYELLEAKRIAWDSLYEYVLKTYYIREVPPSMITALQQMQNTYPYSILLDCLKSLEKSIKTYMREDDFTPNQKTGYIITALKNNIDDFYSRTIKKEAEMKNIKTEDFQFLDAKKKKAVEKLDIVDLE
jgi:hypothetical protein